MEPPGPYGAAAPILMATLGINLKEPAPVVQTQRTSRCHQA